MVVSYEPLFGDFTILPQMNHVKEADIKGRGVNVLFRCVRFYVIESERMDIASGFSKKKL